MAEELGSGIKNIFKYARMYAGTVPVVTDDTIFKFEWPVRLFTENIVDQVSDQVSDQVNYDIEKILKFMEIPRSLVEIMSQTPYSSRVHFMKKVLKPLIMDGIVIRTVPDKPNSPKQKYIKNPHYDKKQITLKL